MQLIAFDSHKHYTLASVEDEGSGDHRETRLPHQRGALRQFLEYCERGSSVAVETIGNWYWIVDEIEAAGLKPQLVHARKAKLMMGMINKTDKLDVRGMNQLQRNGTLPTVWIPPGELRDQRDLPRTRMVLVRQKTQLKNRLHSTLDKYALTIQEVTDIFGVEGHRLIKERIKQLPPHTAYVTEQLLQHVDVLETRVADIETRMAEAFQETEEIKLLRTVPGVGPILSVVIALELGDVSRFPSPDRLASYSGTTPRVHSSGGKTRYGRLRPDVNRYLKWAFLEAATGNCRLRAHRPNWHVTHLYERISHRAGHGKAIGAVARHLAEATYWVLTKKEPYREPNSTKVSSTKGQAR